VRKEIVAKTYLPLFINDLHLYNIHCLTITNPKRNLYNSCTQTM
jgi:hypothetical protein